MAGEMNLSAAQHREKVFHQGICSKPAPNLVFQLAGVELNIFDFVVKIVTRFGALL